MRLFTAINFDDKTKDSLCESIDALKAHGITGNFSRRENLHLTVVFIGETARVSDITAALGGLRAAPFTLGLGGLGAFRGGLLWCGIKENPVLSGIYASLGAELKRRGFSVEDRPFSPHLTVCREAVVPTGLNIKDLSPLFPPLTQNVGKISLMKSERLNGKLTYTEVFAKTLQNG